MVNILLRPTKEELKEQIKIAQEFSPIGGLPPDFGKWFRIGTTTLGGKKMKGVFATRNLPSNLILGEYKGDVEYRGVELGPKLVNKDEGSYLFQLKVGKRYKYIDGEDEERSSWLRFINRPEKKGEENSHFFSYYSRVYAVTNRPVKKGEQIFIWYLLLGENHITNSQKSTTTEPT